MQERRKRTIWVLGLALALTVSGVSAAAPDDPLDTRVTMLIGFPKAGEDAGSVLVAPGWVHGIHGKCHPPRNSTEIKALAVIMWAYSPRKNMPNLRALYSV